MRCPLLEDVNLNGARGILVNISAGMDLGMDEFKAVGDAIGEFASENALVVIGTALSESDDDEIRVTVVATGLGPPEQIAEQKVRLVTSEPVPQGAPPPRVDADRGDYRRFEVPTIIRNQTTDAPEPIQMFDDDSEIQKIPVFLRRQLD